MRGGGQRHRAVHVEYRVEVKRILTPDEVRAEKLPVGEPPGSTCESIG